MTRPAILFGVMAGYRGFGGKEAKLLVFFFLAVLVFWQEKNRLTRATATMGLPSEGSVGGLPFGSAWRCRNGCRKDEKKIRHSSAQLVGALSRGIKWINNLTWIFVSAELK